uniref:Uncharacterized protein n=1 Tax=uncultured marine virus TaxID=186617 RepID=A0A0F7L8Q4_9VIRU|nr:hypothetical protein [uncultured marine virus]
MGSTPTPLDTDGPESRTMNEFLRELAEFLTSPRADFLFVGVASLPGLVWIAAATRRGQRYPERCHGEK